MDVGLRIIGTVFRYMSFEVTVGTWPSRRESDIFSAGCVMCELISRQPLFNGQNKETQRQSILETFGVPMDNELDGNLPEPVSSRIQELKQPQQQASSVRSRLFSRFPHADPSARDLLAGMLRVGPVRRPLADALLEHRYFTSRQYFNPEVDRKTQDFPWTRHFPWERLKQLKECDADARWRHLYLESLSFHEELLGRDGEVLEELGIGPLLREQQEKGAFSVHWRSQLDRTWRLVSLVVLKSEHRGLREVVNAMSDVVLRQKLFSHFLPPSAFRAGGGE